MQVVGGGDGDQMNLRVVDQPLPVAVGRFESPALGALAGTLRIGVGQGRERQVQGKVEHRLGIMERQGMGAAHEAGANQTDAEFTHEKSPLSFYCQKGSLWNKYSLIANIGINIQCASIEDPLWERACSR